MILERLYEQKAIQPPKWLISNVNYMVIMGSQAYAVSQDTSDMDIYGFCTPPKDMIYTQAAGEITGFGRQIQRFEEYQQHHVSDPSNPTKEYDFSIYNIVKYFDLCMENNPNLLDSLFVPDRCVLYITPVGKHVRDNRKIFLHKGSWFKFKGYAYSQMSKIRNKVNSKNEKRASDIEKYGYSLKYAYHLVRLVLEAEMILVEHDLDIERSREQLKSIRRGEWKLEEIEKWFVEKERQLETTYANSTLRNKPDEDAIKQILVDCLEMSYGTIARCEKQIDTVNIMNDLKALIAKYD